MQKDACLSSAEKSAKKADSKRSKLEENVAELQSKLEKSAAEISDLTDTVATGRNLVAELAKAKQSSEDQRKKRAAAERAQKKAQKDLSEAKAAHAKAVEQTKETVRDEILADLGAEVRSPPPPALVRARLSDGI